MTPDVGTVRAEKRQDRGLQSGFCPPGTLQEGLSTASRVINEVVLRTPVNKGMKKAGSPFLGGGMRWPARPHNGIVIQTPKFGEHPFHAVTRYGAV